VSERKSIAKQRANLQQQTGKMSETEKEEQERAQNLVQRASRLRVEQEDEIKEFSKVRPGASPASPITTRPPADVKTCLSCLLRQAAESPRDLHLATLDLNSALLVATRGLPVLRFSSSSSVCLLLLPLPSLAQRPGRPVVPTADPRCQVPRDP